jgi:hypothetical protein
MANIVLDVSELEAFKEKLLDDYHREQMLFELARQMMEMVREVAKELTPVDTGNLRKSWSNGDNLFLEVVKQGNVYTVSIENKAYNGRGEGEFYASFVEEGYHSRSGRWIPGHWMMQTGEIEAERNAQKMFDAIVRDWWRWVNG